jgi:hypothetical protein
MLISLIFLSNNLNNRIINNNNGKNEILIVRMAAHHWQWCLGNAPVRLARSWECATPTGAFFFFMNLFELHFNMIIKLET